VAVRRHQVARRRQGSQEPMRRPTIEGAQACQPVRVVPPTPPEAVARPERGARRLQWTATLPGPGCGMQSGRQILAQVTACGAARVRPSPRFAASAGQAAAARRWRQRKARIAPAMRERAAAASCPFRNPSGSGMPDGHSCGGLTVLLQPLADHRSCAFVAGLDEAGDLLADLDLAWRDGGLGLGHPGSRSKRAGS
jgi:hypothetical protein